MHEHAIIADRLRVLDDEPVALPRPEVLGEDAEYLIEPVARSRLRELADRV